MDIKLLKSLSNINSGIVLEPGKQISTISAAQNVLAISKQEAEVDFAIYDIPAFLSIISLTSDERKLEVKNNVMEIVDGKTVFKYAGAAKEVVVTPPDDVSPLTEAEYTNHFELTDSQFKQLMNASSVLNAKNVVFTSEGDGVVRITTESDYEDANSFSTEYPAEDSNAVVAKLDRQTIKVADGSYKVSIGERAIRFMNDEIEYYVVRAE